MNDRRLNFWIMVLAGVPAFIWLAAELVRVSLEVWGRSGVWSLAGDGVVQHKVGELMVAVPLYLLLLLANRWPVDKVSALANRTRIVMIAGGVLNAVAWYSLRDREPWDSFFRIWCVILLLVGLFGSQIAKWVTARTRPRHLTTATANARSEKPRQ